MKYKISDLTKILGISQNTIRRYEERGYISPERDENSRYRKFTNTDIYRLFNARILRGFDFGLDEIFDMMYSDTKVIREKMYEKSRGIEAEIERLEKVKRRLDDNIVLLEKCDDGAENFYIRESVAFSFAAMRKNENLLTEGERGEIIKKFMEYSPEVHYGCVIRKEAVLNNSGEYEVGFFVKSEKLSEEERENKKYITEFPSRKVMMMIVKMEGGIDRYMKNRSGNMYAGLREKLEENDAEIDGDILGLTAANVTENGHEIQWILMSVPIRNKV
ncbi:MAG: MerR family transcriptional regulator [Firmicutes bacterium]|nr:MerR family transcriptional regulator [Bacillota bacterium]